MELQVDQSIGPLVQKLREKEEQLVLVRKRLIAKADVVCCTCIGAGANDLSEHNNFSAVLVDECTQAMEPSCLIPLLKLKPQSARLILAGGWLCNNI